MAAEICSATAPKLLEISPGRQTTCSRQSEIPGLQASGKLCTEGPAHISTRGVSTASVLEVSGLSKTFPLIKGAILRRRVGSIYVVDGLDLVLRQGRSLTLVGESGCGRTTTLLEILNMVAPEAGANAILGRSVASLSNKDKLALRKDLQIVFQDPFESLDPRLPVGDAIAEPLRAFGVGREEQNRRVSELLKLVDLNPDHASRYPSEFSGDQRQPIAIARAMALNPKVFALNEPVSALDVSVRAGVLNLLAELPSPASPPSGCRFHTRCQLRSTIPSHIADRCVNERPLLTANGSGAVSCHAPLK